MSAGFNLLFLIIVGTVLAVFSATVMLVIVALLTRNVKTGRRKLLVLTALFPFACFLWFGANSVFDGIVSVKYLHRDIGLGDSWYVTLPNGYVISFIDFTDYGQVYNPKTQGSSSGVSSQEDAVFDVRKLQIAGRYILGYAEPNPDFHQIDRATYFLLDTQMNRRTQFETYDALRTNAIQLNITPDLKPAYDVYCKYRSSWFDTFGGLLCFAVPFIGIILLIRQIVRLRRTKIAPPTIT